MDSNRQWTQLSEFARSYLSRTNLNAFIGHEIANIESYLDQNHCPHFPAFVEYLAHFSGIVLPTTSDCTNQVVVYLKSLRDTSPARVRWCDRFHEWHLSCVQYSNSHVSVEMRPNGELVHYHGKDQWSNAVASSITIFLEDMALRTSLEANSEFTTDNIMTPATDIQKRLNQHHHLELIQHASDSYITWWKADEAYFRLSVSGFARCPMARRMSLRAFWHRANTSKGTAISTAFTELLEPHLQRRRQFSAVHLAINHSDVSSILAADTLTHPAASFRNFALRELVARTAIHGVDPPAVNPVTATYFSYCFEAANRISNPECLHFAAVGLAAFGDKFALQVILDTAPFGEGSDWTQPLWAAQYLGFLLPLSYVFCIPEEACEAQLWLTDNLHRLFWDEQRGRYALRGSML